MNIFKTKIHPILAILLLLGAAYASYFIGVKLLFRSLNDFGKSEEYTSQLAPDHDCVADILAGSTLFSGNSYFYGSATSNILLMEASVRGIDVYTDEAQATFAAQLQSEGLDPYKEIGTYFVDYACRGEKAQRYPAGGQPKFYLEKTGPFQPL